jgi:diguanylate cyclase
VALVREQRRARRRGVPFCLVRFDADRFGDWNRRYGVEAGDRLLCAAGSRLAGRLRRSDFVARTGGDDFFLLLPHADRGGGERAAERIRRLLGAGFEGCPPGPTWSAGVAGFRADAAGSSAIVAAAITAVERAQRSGGDRVAANSPSHRSRIDV